MRYFAGEHQRAIRSTEPIKNLAWLSTMEIAVPSSNTHTAGSQATNRLVTTLKREMFSVWV
jgi:hypothetical protein